MKDLFDCTVKQFDKKVVYERNNIKMAYEKILLDQRQEMKVSEKKYDYLILNKVKKMEDFVHELAIGQAKLLEKVVSTS